MEVIAITNMVQGLGEIPNGVVLYKRDHPFHPYVVHHYADNRSFNNGTALTLFQGTYVGHLDVATDEYERRLIMHNSRDQFGQGFETAKAAFFELLAQNKDG